MHISIFLNYHIIDSQPFAKKARESYEVLQNMFKNMDSLYSEISEFFSFDKQKYTIEEFFGDIKTFKDDFTVSKIVRKIGWFLTRYAPLTARTERNNKAARGRRETETSERSARKSGSGKSCSGCAETSACRHERSRNAGRCYG